MGYQTVVVNVRCEATDELEAVHVLGDEEVRAALAGTSSPWAQWEELLAIGEHLHGAVWISEGIEVPDRLTTWTPKHASAIGPEAWHPDDMLLLPLRDSSGAVTAILSVDEPLHGMRPDEPELRTLMAAVEHAALTLEHVAREGALTGVAARSSEARLAAVMLLAEAIDLRDAGTAQHSRMVGAYARDTAVALRLDADRVEKLHAAGVLHDLGKVGIADSILRKPGKLDAGEWEEMRRHPEVGARILERAGLEDIARWVLLHHERLDGAGYPHGLSAQEIPLEARILAVVDAYEAMTADRPYRRGMSADAAREELLRCSGSQFDPVVVEAFLASREGVVQDRSVVASH
jgi:HD-GYP domain-containing protein (c-di-GMP phosphodiesterase class II)